MSGVEIRKAVRIGLIAGLVAASVSAIGMVQTFNERDIITGILTLGQVLLFSAPLVGGFVAVDPKQKLKIGPVLLKGIIIGFMTAIPLVILIFLPIVFPGIRDKLVNVSPGLINILTFGQGPVLGSLILTVVMIVLGAVGSLFHMLPGKIERPLVSGVMWVLAIGLFSEILINILRPLLPRQVVRLLFGTSGITLISAIIIFIGAVAVTAWWESSGRERQKARSQSRSPEQQKRVRLIGIIAGVVLVLAAPWFLGIYLTEIMDIVGIFVIMGLGLNIVVGFAGLLDLGYVALFCHRGLYHGPADHIR